MGRRNSEATIAHAWEARVPTGRSTYPTMEIIKPTRGSTISWIEPALERVGNRHRDLEGYE